MCWAIKVAYTIHLSLFIAYQVVSEMRWLENKYQQKLFFFRHHNNNNNNNDDNNTHTHCTTRLYALYFINCLIG